MIKKKKKESKKRKKRKMILKKHRQIKMNKNSKLYRKSKNMNKMITHWIQIRRKKDKKNKKKKRKIIKHMIFHKLQTMLYLRKLKLKMIIMITKIIVRMH